MKNLHKNIGIFSLSMFAAATAAYIYSPVIGSHADSSATADINLTVGEVMNLTLDTNSLNLSTAPNNFVSGVINATASTNSQYGYTLTLEDVDSNTNLVHTNENIEATVSSSFSGSKTSSEMEANTWGFSLNETDFYKVPANGSPVALKRTTTPMATASETTPVTFGAKVGNLTSGTYTDSVLFTMYVNGQDGKPNTNPPVDPTDPDAEEETTMQSFTCAETLPLEQPFTLTDSRDGNKYTIKKLRDGLCWMTDNLRIADITLTSTDSNLPDGETFTIPASSPVGFTTIDANVAYVNDTYGGYYTFLTATAGWGSSSVNLGNAPKDICPKGWRLPTGGMTNANTVYGEYDRLFHTYDTAELLQDIPNFKLGGYGLLDEMYTDINEGLYWSGTSYNGKNAYFAYISPSAGLKAQDVIPKTSGFNVRCVKE
jgi:uncharacterized protein (TIGR02145 family)